MRISDWSSDVCSSDLKIVREAAIEAGKQEIVIASKGVTPEDPSMLKDIESHGVTVTSLTPEQHEAFVKVNKPVVEKWKKTKGADMVTQAQKDSNTRKKRMEKRREGKEGGVKEG